MTEATIQEKRRRAKESYHEGEMARLAETGFEDAKRNARAMKFVAACREDVIALADECLRLKRLLAEKGGGSVSG